MLVRELARLFVTAFRQVSFLSARRNRLESPERIGQSSVFFPMVGFSFGLFLVVVYFLLSRILGIELVCLIIILILFLFAGPGQVQASMDIFERWTFWARPPGEADRLAGIGVIGISGLFFLIMFKFLALVHIGPGWIYPLLVLMPTFSRWSLVYLNRSVGQTLGDDSTSLQYARFVGGREFWIATLFTIVAAALFMGLSGLFIFMFVAMWTTIIERFSLDGHTPSVELVFKASMEMNEVMVLLAAILMSKTLSLTVSRGIWL